MNTYVFKVVLLGNYEVGKTTLFKKLRDVDRERPTLTRMRKEFSDSLDLAPCMLEFMLAESVQVKLEINDTGSIEKFRGSIPTNYFRRCHGVVLMYDLTDPASVDDLKEWTADAQNKTAGDSTITYALIGNKVDIVRDDALSDAGEIFSLGQRIPENLQFKISALTESKDSLQDIFMTIARSIYTAQMNREPEDRETSVLLSARPEEASENKTTSCSKC